mmetsp:Transcript_21054/g.39443  ORF Transcript_21054/g.39443 Transcript_21054/m.39443 type:complete len:358 (+) Transcript_21054:695-1768(+)
MAFPSCEPPLSILHGSELGVLDSESEVASEAEGVRSVPLGRAQTHQLNAEVALELQPNGTGVYEAKAQGVEGPGGGVNGRHVVAGQGRRRRGHGLGGSDRDFRIWSDLQSTWALLLGKLLVVRLPEGRERWVINRDIVIEANVAAVHELKPLQVETGVLELELDPSAQIGVAIATDDSLPVSNLELGVEGLLRGNVVVELNELQVRLSHVETLVADVHLHLLGQVRVGGLLIENAFLARLFAPLLEVLVLVEPPRELFQVPDGLSEVEVELHSAPGNGLLRVGHAGDDGGLAAAPVLLNLLNFSTQSNSITKGVVEVNDFVPPAVVATNDVIPDLPAGGQVVEDHLGAVRMDEGVQL